MISTHEHAVSPLSWAQEEFETLAQCVKPELMGGKRQEGRGFHRENDGDCPFLGLMD